MPYSIDVFGYAAKGRRFVPPFYGTRSPRLREQKCDARRPVCDHCRLSGKSDECVYEDTRKLADKSENAQRRELLPVDTSTAVATHPTSGPSHDPPKDLSCVLPAHLSKLHPLVAAFMKQSTNIPPGPFFDAVSNVSLDDLTLAL